MIRLKRLYVNTASSFCIIIGLIGSSEFRRNLYGCFGGAYGKKSIIGTYTDVIRMNSWVASQEIFFYHRNLDGY